MMESTRPEGSGRVRRTMEGGDFANVLIVADDLTGAMDAGAEFGKRGVPTLVAVDWETDFGAAWGNYRVLAVDAESRHLPPREAAERIGWIVKRGLASGATHFFKKTDSTLRGNVGAELEALGAAAGGGAAVCFVAAAPLYGRTTREGIHYVGETLLHRSAFARDPLEPISESHVPTLLAKQTRLPVTLLRRDELTEPSVLSRTGIVLFDAESETDVAAVTEWLRCQGQLRVLAGTARFASHLADALAIARGRIDRVGFGAGLLIVNGSVNETALEQVRRARATGAFRSAALTAEILLADSGERWGLEQRLLDGLAGDDQRGILIYSALGREDVGRYMEAAARLGLSGRELHMAAAKMTAGFVRRLIARRGFGLIVVFGGDTLAALTRTMQWRGFHLRGEIVAGVALSEVCGSDGLFVAAKPGGFGPPEVIERIREYYLARV